MIYKLLIADDESIELNAVKLMVSKNLLNFEVVGEASNGLEAVEQARALNPDIILLDIKMPGLDGLRAIEEIRKFNKDVRFVMLTAHNDFEYAQTALKLGADDYLLKPAKIHKLTEALENIAKSIENRRLQHIQEKRMQSKIESLRPDLNNRIVTSIAAGSSTFSSLEQYTQFLDVDLQNSICAVVALKKPLSLEKERSAFLSDFEDKLHSICPVFLSGFAFDTFVVFIPVDSEWDNDRVEQWNLDLSRFIKNTLASMKIYHTSIGISKATKSLDQIYDAYRHAAKAACRSLIETAKETYSPNATYRKELKLCEKIALGDIDQSLNLFNELFDVYKLCNPDNLLAQKSKIRDLIIIIKRKIINELNQSIELNQIVEAQLLYLEQVFSIQELHKQVLSYISRCVALCEKSGTGSNKILDSAVDYISNNFKTSFSLDDIALKFGVSAPYLSRLFKHRLGKNFIDYITELRIQYAKELLAKKDKSIKEITFMVGYNSQTYFCKVFKKAVGISASQYLSQYTMPNEISHKKEEG